MSEPSTIFTPVYSSFSPKWGELPVSHLVSMIFFASPSISRDSWLRPFGVFAGSTCDPRPGKRGEISGSQDAGAGEIQKIGG